MTASKADKERDQILGRMLNTPPDPKVVAVKKRTKKRKKTRSTGAASAGT